MRLYDLASTIGGKLLADDHDAQITGAASLEEAGNGDVTYLDSTKFIGLAEKTRATAVIVAESINIPGKNLITVENPKLGFARAIEALLPYLRPATGGGISSEAFIGEGVELGEDVGIAPSAHLESGVKIGDRTAIYPGVYLGRNVSVGSDCVLFPNAVVMDGCRIGARVTLHAGSVIGSDGFGYVTDSGRHHKIPQVGIVVIEDDVEIGANSTVDRATVGATVIGSGTKLDNLIQVAHNVKIGSGCLLASQVGIAGSSTLGDYVMFGGQVGVADHVSIGDRVMVGAQSGIAKDVQSGLVVSGSPTFAHRDWIRANLVFQRLPDVEKRLRALEKTLDGLKTDKDKSGEKT